MNRTIKHLAVALIALAPGLALAQTQTMPKAGDVLGTDAKTVKAALEAAGCPVEKFEAEDGTVEAMCVETATGETFEIAIDPQSGAILSIKTGD